MLRISFLFVLLSLSVGAGFEKAEAAKLPDFTAAEMLCLEGGLDGFRAVHCMPRTRAEIPACKKCLRSFQQLCLITADKCNLGSKGQMLCWTVTMPDLCEQ